MLSHEQIKQTRLVLAGANLALAKLQEHEPGFATPRTQACQGELVNLMRQLEILADEREVEHPLLTSFYEEET